MENLPIYLLQCQKCITITEDDTKRLNITMNELINKKVDLTKYIEQSVVNHNAVGQIVTLKLKIK